MTTKPTFSNPEFTQDQFLALFGFLDGMQVNGKTIDNLLIERCFNGEMICTCNGIMSYPYRFIVSPNANIIKG